MVDRHDCLCGFVRILNDLAIFLQDLHLPDKIVNELRNIDFRMNHLHLVFLQLFKGKKFIEDDSQVIYRPFDTVRVYDFLSVKVLRGVVLEKKGRG